MIFNSVIVGGGGGTGCGLTVTAPEGATVTVAKDGDTRTGVALGGQAEFQGLESGLWTVTVTDGSQSVSQELEMNAAYAVTLRFPEAPAFTYTGTYALTEEGADGWKLRLLTSGTLRFTQLNGAADGVDVFLVGGGGGVSGSRTNYGGAGGGCTATVKQFAVTEGTDYAVTVGEGGAGTDGGATAAFGFNAPGGHAPTDFGGGAGGSGGGAGWISSATGSVGGCDGQNAPDGSNYPGGAGQGSTTREFGETDGTLYAGGGGGGSGSYDAVLSGGAGGGGDTNQNGAANTGGGGGAARKGSTTTGGSGIVIIRPRRGN